MLRALALIAAALLLAACEPHLSDANLREVKPEMTTKEVESLLGLPGRVENANPPGGPQITRYIYEQEGREVVLTFSNDRLLPEGVQGSFEK